MFQHARKLTGRPYASTLMRAAKGGDEARGWRETKGGEEGGVFPHYKFNLTNGSENLETMEYMKCGRVYHAGGDAGWFRRQYCQGRSIFSESATPREPSGVGGGGGGESDSHLGWGRTGEWQNMLLARQETARGGRRTVPVAFKSCRANAGVSSLCFFVSRDVKTIFPSKYDREGFHREDLIRC